MKNGSMTVLALTPGVALVLAGVLYIAFGENEVAITASVWLLGFAAISFLFAMATAAIITAIGQRRR